MLCEFVWKDQHAKSDEEETYDEYRKKYCLNYVRAFFNKHLDDSWFRQKYSPAVRRKVALQERERATGEAKIFARQAKEESFIATARLGYGVKQDKALNVPSSHLLNIDTIQVKDIPHYVTDDQLALALQDHCTLREEDMSIKVFSCTPSMQQRNYLHREAFCVAADPAVKRNILRNLQRHDVPRKEDDFLELSVECSDPYGRLEYDDDGKGGAPSDGLAIPHRKAVVLVSGNARPPTVQVLSAALSSSIRIPRDKEAATTIARALDASQQIPDGCKLDDILDSLAIDSDSDVLDISLAYLRRVHLFSFYNACSHADSTGNLLSGKHNASIIHLRLKDADEILEPTEDSTTDLLVKRLDETIEKALESCSTWIHPGGGVVDEETAQAADEIERQEQEAVYTWVSHHSIDDDGRARCSFHFCHKLFKDNSFLEKHLMKKHVEYLFAEQAKCHDAYMMKAWDAEPNREVPDILVDCGAKFGLVASRVSGQEPLADDPEPELWKKEDERRQREAEMRTTRQAQRQKTHQEEPRKYIDVDDMKEEKVELNFDNVDVPIATKKKKKKRKLL